MPLSESLTHLLEERYDGRIGRAGIVGPGRAAYRALCDKEGLGRTARAAGVRASGGVVLRPGTPPERLPLSPCVVKPVASATPRPDGVVYRPVVVAGDVATRAPRDRGDDGGCTFARWAGGFVAVAWHTATSSPRGTGMSSVSCMESVPAAFGAAGARLTSVAGYRRIGSLQLFETAEGPVVPDANLRSVFSVGAAMRAGLDLPAIAVAVACDEPGPDCIRVRPTRYVWLAGEARGMAEDLQTARPRAAAWAASGVAAAAPLDPGRVLDPADARALVDTARAITRRRNGVAATGGSPGPR